MAENVVLKREQVWRDEMPNGTWKQLKRPDGSLSAIVRCPKCGNFTTLTDHTIHPDGRVEPSIGCPWPECQPDFWHVFAKLEGWETAEVWMRDG